MRIVPAVLLYVVASLSIAAAQTPSPARAEINALLARLQSSGCTFNRNGTWYSAADAKDHLLKKLEYLEGKGAVRTSEQFIDLGASTSAVSGKPYMVKCGNDSPVESKVWLSTQLKSLRSPSAAASAPN